VTKTGSKKSVALICKLINLSHQNIKFNANQSEQQQKRAGEIVKVHYFSSFFVCN